jgi:hypothetical protein
MASLTARKMSPTTLKSKIKPAVVSIILTTLCWMRSLPNERPSLLVLLAPRLSLSCQGNKLSQSNILIIKERKLLQCLTRYCAITLIVSGRLARRVTDHGD